MPKEVWIDTDEMYPCHIIRDVEDWLRKTYPEEIAIVDEDTLLRWKTARNAFYEAQSEMAAILVENRRKKEKQKVNPSSVDTPE